MEVRLQSSNGDLINGSDPQPVGMLQHEGMMVPGQGYWVFMNKEGTYTSIENLGNFQNLPGSNGTDDNVLIDDSIGDNVTIDEGNPDNGTTEVGTNEGEAVDGTNEDVAVDGTNEDVAVDGTNEDVAVDNESSDNESSNDGNTDVGTADEIPVSD